MNRCEKHKIFIGKNGCKICNEIIGLKNEILQLKLPKTPEAVKFATKYLTRNEKQIMINLLGAQSMLAVLVDHFNKIPENRKQAINPLYDYVINICEKVDYLNSEIAEHMAKQISAKEFENTITDVASVCDFMAGKITKCKTCTAWLDNKAKNRNL